MEQKKFNEAARLPALMSKLLHRAREGADHDRHDYPISCYRPLVLRNCSSRPSPTQPFSRRGEGARSLNPVRYCNLCTVESEDSMTAELAPAPAPAPSATDHAD